MSEHTAEEAEAILLLVRAGWLKSELWARPAGGSGDEIDHLEQL